MSVWRGEASAELHAEASLPGSAVPTQNMDRKSLLASCPRLQAGEYLCAVEEGNRSRLSAQKSDNAHAFSCVLPLRLGRCQSQPLVSKLDCERKANRRELLPASGDTLCVPLPFQCRPRSLAKPDREGNDCRCHEQTGDKCDEGMVLPQVVQWTDPVEPRLT